MYALPALKDTAVQISTAPYQTIQDELIDLHRKLGACLSSIVDKNSADKAVEDVLRVTEKLQEIQEREKKLPAPPNYVQAELRKRPVMNEITEINRSAAEQMLHLLYVQEQPCYGSTALEAALNQLLHQFSASI